ncbi:MAG: tetratricopeptide repeat protein, partial [Bacteroidetes bacterium]|nr:tetratricopeptide repeat protein [Bacteroidota bacterium]
ASFAEYRDIIYYTIAKIELERNNIPGAEAALLKCAKYALPNSTYKNKAFLQLGDIAFDQKKYKAAKNFYDSVSLQDKNAVEDAELFKDRKNALDKIVVQLLVIERQDSLQHIAAMPPGERDAYVKKLVKRLRKEQGLKEEEQQTGTQNFVFNNNNANTNLFGASPDNAEWYFNNTSLRSRGFGEFKAKWGNRQNIDNWQVASISSQQLQKKANDKGINQNGVNANSLVPQITFAALMANLPLTPDKMKASNDSVEKALFLLGKAYQEGLPDYAAAADAYEKLLSRYPETNSYEEILMNLYYCYRKIGDDMNAARILSLMKQKFPSGKFTQRVTDPKAINFELNAEKADATKKYEDIYTAFIEGRFEEAQAEKQVADSMYGKKYWTPQLLYIEAVYFIKQRQDSLAKVDLAHIVNEYKGTPMAERAKIFLDVLSRRRQIEDYLTNLKIERAKDDSVVITATTTPVTNKIDTVTSKSDSAQIAKAKIKVNPVLQDRQKQDSIRSGIGNIKLSDIQAAKIKTDSAMMAKLQHQADSIQNAMRKIHADSVQMAQMKHVQDSIQLALKKIKDNLKTSFSYNPDQPHYVV